MSTATDNLEAAQRQAMAIRPQVGGFPILADTLHRAGVRRNIWSLPSAQSIYFTDDGPVVVQGTPLLTGVTDVPRFDESALVSALRVDQAGKSTFAQFLLAAWEAGVVSYACDLDARTVTYRGANGESYVEAYAAVQA